MVLMAMVVLKIKMVTVLAKTMMIISIADIVLNLFDVTRWDNLKTQKWLQRMAERGFP